MGVKGFVLFKGVNTGGIFYGNIPVDSVYYGDTLIWKYLPLLMGSDKYVCIEFIPDHDIVSSSQNPVAITVFMNTNDFNDTNPPMWILDAAGVTCGYSTVGVVYGQETIEGCTGYRRTNTFLDNKLFLQAGKKYYICYKKSRHTTDSDYFAYYDKPGNYKLFNVSQAHTTIQNLVGKNNIGTLTSFVDLIAASQDDLFIWKGRNKSGMTRNDEYIRNGDSLSNYVPELNFGSSDKYEVLNHILFMDKGSGQYGSPGDKFVITETYSNESSAPAGVISRTSNYTNHVWIPPSASFFSREADAYKYIFDARVHLSDNDSQGKALVWGNNYIYTYGACYSRGSQYLGYSCYESRTSSYIDSPSDLANVQTNELFYIDSTVAAIFNTYSGLKIRGSTTFDTVCTVADGNDFYAAFRTVTAATESGKAFTTVTQNTTYQWYNAVYERKSGWQNKIGSSAITVEPSNPSTGDVYWKGTTTSGWSNQWGGSITEECLVKWGGSYWIKVETHQEQDYFTTTSASNLFSAADTNGILNEFQPGQLFQSENVTTLLTHVTSYSDFAAETVNNDKEHYFEIVEGT